MHDICRLDMPILEPPQSQYLLTSLVSLKIHVYLEADSCFQNFMPVNRILFRIARTHQSIRAQFQLPIRQKTFLFNCCPKVTREVYRSYATMATDPRSYVLNRKRPEGMYACKSNQMPDTMLRVKDPQRSSELFSQRKSFAQVVYSISQVL